MAQKKDYKFPYDLLELSQFHFAFSHPARLQIVRRLKGRPNASFDQLATGIPLHRATISQHISILRRIGLIQPSELSSGAVGYKLNQEMYAYAKGLMKMDLPRVA